MSTGESADDQHQLIGRSYTRARRFPLVIGQLPGGGRLIGGPYTLTQIGVMAGSVLVLYLSAPVWAHLGAANVLVLLGLPYAAAWLVRHARLEGREPLKAAAGFAAFVFAPATGRIRGGVCRPPRPVRLTAARFLVTPAAPSPAPAPVAVSAPARSAPQPGRSAAEPVPASAVGRLKAAAATTSRSS